MTLTGRTSTNYERLLAVHSICGLLHVPSFCCTSSSDDKRWLRLCAFLGNWFPEQKLLACAVYLYQCVLTGLASCEEFSFFHWWMMIITFPHILSAHCVDIAAVFWRAMNRADGELCSAICVEISWVQNWFLSFHTCLFDTTAWCTRVCAILLLRHTLSGAQCDVLSDAQFGMCTVT